MGNVFSRLHSNNPLPSPFDHLPNETMCDIFVHLRRDLYANNTTDWISVIHVCRRWRDVALSCAPFWANIDWTMRQSAREFFLVNAKGYPLNVMNIDIYSDDDEENENFLLDNLDRIGKLHIDFHPHDQAHAERWMTKLLSPTDAPLLRYLVLEMDPSNYGSIPVIVAVNENPIRISSLTLTDVRLCFSTNCAQTHVEHFSFTSPQTDHRLPTLAETKAMLTMVELMPNLVSLAISDHNILPDEDLAVSLSLPRLQMLSFDGLFSGFVFLWKHLLIMPHTQLKLRLSVTGSDSIHDSIFYTEIGAHLKRRGQAETQDHTYRVTIDNHVWFVHGDPPLFQTVKVTEIPHAPTAAISSTPIDIVLEFDDFFQHAAQYSLLHLCKLMENHTRLRVEHLEITSNLAYADLGSARPDEFSLLGWQGLKTLVLGDVWCTDWLMPHLQRRQGSLFTFFPELEQLELRGIQPDGYSIFMDMDEMERAIKHIFVNLRAGLEARGRSDSQKIKTLAIRGSCVPKEWMVSEVTIDWCNLSMIWDGEGWEDHWESPFYD